MVPVLKVSQLFCDFSTACFLFGFLNLIWKSQKIMPTSCIQDRAHTTEDVYVFYNVISFLIFWSLENSVLKVS